MITNRRVLITGANRGLGLGFTGHYLESDWEVFAAARNIEGSAELQTLKRDFARSLHLISMDVSSENSIQDAAEMIRQVTGALDLLINNAGVYGERKDVSIEQLDLEDLQYTIDINTLGPLRVTRAFLPLLKAGSGKKLVHITSLMGSIADNSSGGSYGYRISKAALNMLSKNLSHDLASEGIISVAMHPGWVQTDMGGKQAPLTIEASISAMTDTIESLTASKNGMFLRYDGQVCPN